MILVTFLYQKITIPNHIMRKSFSTRARYDVYAVIYIAIN